MTYEFFKSAARRHKNTCKSLLDRLQEENYLNKRYLIQNIYYLSGYVIECILKYAIYEAIGYDREKDVKLLDEIDIKYRRDIKKHNLNQLSQTLKTILPNSSFHLFDNECDINFRILDLFRDWKPDHRYFDIGGIEESEVEMYLDHILKCYKDILLFMRG